MILNFLKDYNEWKKTHKEEVQEAILRKEAMKTPLNYNILDKMFQAFIHNGDQGAVLEIEGKDFKVKMYYDNDNKYQRLTTTEQIVNSYRGIQ